MKGGTTLRGQCSIRTVYMSGFWGRRNPTATEISPNQHHTSAGNTGHTGAVTVMAVIRFTYVCVRVRTFSLPSLYWPHLISLDWTQPIKSLHRLCRTQRHTHTHTRSETPTLIDPVDKNTIWSSVGINQQQGSTQSEAFHPIRYLCVSVFVCLCVCGGVCTREREKVVTSTYRLCVWVNESVAEFKWFGSNSYWTRLKSHRDIQ